MINISEQFVFTAETAALLSGIFMWGMTAAGAAIVLFFKRINKNFLDAMLGIAAGVMVAASFWSLLSPAKEASDSLGQPTALVLTLGFLLGGVLLYCADKLLSATKLTLLKENSASKRSLLLLFSVTVHNIPEGLAVGVAFGSAALGIEGAAPLAALMLAIGIAIQNLPEGMAVSVPLYRDGASRRRAFFFGQLSGVVEPISALFGAMLVIYMREILPLTLSFAAGAMIYVVSEELIPESQTNENKDLMAIFTLLGFSIMTFLDVALG